MKTKQNCHHCKMYNCCFEITVITMGKVRPLFVMLLIKIYPMFFLNIFCWNFPTILTCESSSLNMKHTIIKRVKCQLTLEKCQVINILKRKLLFYWEKRKNCHLPAAYNQKQHLEAIKSFDNHYIKW